jgi:hypothetical protein
MPLYTEARRVDWLTTTLDKFLKRCFVRVPTLTAGEVNAPIWGAVIEHRPERKTDSPRTTLMDFLQSTYYAPRMKLLRSEGCFSCNSFHLDFSEYDYEDLAETLPLSRK